MRNSLRATLTAIFVSLVALLAGGVAGSYQLNARLQQQIADLRLPGHVSLEVGMLRRLGSGIATAAAPAPALHALAHAAATDLRQQASNPAAQELATRLEALVTVAARAPAQSTTLAATLDEYEAALETYEAGVRASNAAVGANLRTPVPGMLFTATALLLASLGLARLYHTLSTSVLKPLSELANALDAVRAGDLHAPLPTNVSSEFAPLITGFSQMTEALRQRQEALGDQLRRTTLLTQLSLELRESLDPAAVAERVICVLGNNLGLDEALIVLHNPPPGHAPGHSWRQGSVAALRPERAAQLIDQGIEGLAQRLGRSVVIADVGKNERWRAGGWPAVGSAIVLPLRQGERTLGSLTVYVRRPEHFANRDLLLMEGVVAQAAVALSAAQRYQEECQRSRQAMALLTMTQMLTVERSRAELATMLATQAHTIFQAEAGMLYLCPPDGRPVRVEPLASEAGPALSSDIHRRANEAAAGAYHQGTAVILGADDRSGSCVALPLIHAGRPLGACVLVRSGSGTPPLPVTDESVLSVFMHIIASACANIELVEQQRRYTAELESLLDRHTLDLRRSRDLLRVVFDNLTEGLLLLDAEGAILAANSSFCRSIVGRLPREVVGRGYQQLWEEVALQSELRIEPQGPPEAPALVPASGERVAGDGTTWRVLTTDLVGQQRWYAVERLPVVGQASSQEQYLERWRDITQQEELQRRMLVHEQLTSLGRLAASVAHEVGNPLQSALVCLELCKEDTGISVPTREYLDLATGELERMARTMDSLRNLYRPPQINWTTISLNEILRQVARFTQGHLRKARVQIELDLDEHLPPVIGQADSLRQVFLNLTLNALDALRDGGTIRVITRQKATDRACLVVVQDNGSGMSSEQLAHLFEPFRSGKAQGVGLGLYLSRQIIEQHRGQIEIGSQPGKGTTVTVLIPWSDAGPAHERTDAICVANEAEVSYGEPSDHPGGG